MGNALEIVGNLKKAIECFELVSSATADRIPLEEKFSSEITQSLAYKAIRLAQLQAKNDQPETAIATLQAILEKFDKRVEISDQELDEKRRFSIQLVVI